MIIASFKEGENKVYTKAAYQYDKGQMLVITGIALPETFEIHFSNDKEYGIASSYVGSMDGVMIPNAYFLSGDYIYAWVHSVTKIPDEDPKKEVTVRQTVYEIVIPIIRRPSQLPTAKPADGTSGYVVQDEVLIPVQE